MPQLQELQAVPTNVEYFLTPCPVFLLHFSYSHLPSFYFHIFSNIINPVIIIESTGKGLKIENFFTISEFAKLRNININSLRYYEKLGLLKPAFIDEKTNYRYYKAEQLTVLDKIILCINLGIPLKEMIKYIDSEGNLHSKELLEHGRLVAQDRMNQLQNTLNFIDFSLKSIESNKEFVNKKDTYLRPLDERRIITSDLFVSPMSIKEVVSQVSEIYKTAQEKELFPILPAGQLFQVDASGTIRYRLFLQIMDQEKELPNITTLPAGIYSCMQVELNASTNLAQLIRDNAADDEYASIIVDNIILDKYSYGCRPSELQKLQVQH